jgi:hypothetical protein
LAESYTDKLFPLCERFSHTGLEIINEANLTVTKHGMLEPKIIALTLLSRTLSHFRALMLLTKARFVVESRILARCCFENLFLIGGLHTEGFAFVERMKDDDRAGRKGRLRFALETDSIFDSLSIELKEAVKERHQEFRAASKLGFLNPKDASGIGPFKETYIAYSQMSGDAAHPTITALARHWSPGPTGKVGYFDVQPEPKDDELDETLNLVCVALIGMMVTVNEIIGFTESGKKLTALNHELKVLQAEKWGADSISEGMEIKTEKPRDEA